MAPVCDRECWLQLGAIYLQVLVVTSAPFFGSFAATAILRTLRQEDIISKRSTCLSCHTVLSVAELIPIWGWIGLKGQCRHCGTKITPLYPALEAAFLLIALWSLAVMPTWLIVPTALLGWILLALAIFDFRAFILPDGLTLPLCVAGLALSAWMEEGDLMQHVIGFVIGGAMFLAVRILYRSLRGQDGLGLGDVKLFAAAGAWVTWQGLASVLLIGSLIGLVFGLAGMSQSGGPMRTRKVPFGTFLCLGFWLTWAHGPLETHWFAP